MDDTSPAAARLADLLGTRPPRSVQHLPAPVLNRLVEQIEAGRRHHLKVADDATNDALRGVPLPVRGIVRKALT
ncbi:hypothetical protein [uncultured Jatrophihabitans sp.]|uniref:hypothetical protein n=1 Tax=uncultured Jatrophihabitans sp. TaxID=1610747 RepID=UPI0035CACBD4